MSERPDPDPTSDLVRLTRRLERERAARREAESIAERGLRELWERQRQLAFLESIAKAANSTAPSREVLALALEQVCVLTGWPLGHVFLTRRRRGGTVMASVDIWHGDDAAAMGPFRRASEQIEFTAGVGLPGRVLASKAPAWISRIESDDNFVRTAAAAEAGLTTALGFPVLVGRQVAAVLEFYTTEATEPDEKLLTLMAQIGGQLGRSLERERVETRLQAKNRKLHTLVHEAQTQRLAAEAASRAKSAFLAVTSHEVRTPLNAVLGLAEGLQREQLTTPQASLVAGILDSGAMLMRLLNAVLDLSKVESGAAVLRETSFALGATLATVVRVWSPKADELGIELTLDTADLPEPCWILADEGKIEQSLINLISNALKFTPSGGRVRVRADAAPSRAGFDIRLGVDDEGPGVPIEDRARIFQPYEQTAVGRDAGGAGLGLSICGGHMSLMGGSISVETGEAGGALFVLAFPARAAAIPLAAEPAAEPTQTAGLRVLVAEDNHANRRVMQVLLGPTGADLTFAVNGLEALEVAQISTFDLILMDANMPLMDGVDAVRAIRALAAPRAATPIHMLTANAFEEDVLRYLAAGADGVLSKPVDVAALFELLTSLSGKGVAGSRAA
ncbi:response regulator [Phenylobacterium sp.]|uniref:response regulator n=1 Tax=Phenylobacterium sp. TaxID=1871053 RepID=UPI0025FD8D43|nr:response regulator [Phenylobacterium sp.]